MKTVKCQVWLRNVPLENTQMIKSVLWFRFRYTKFLKWQNGRAKTGNPFLHHVDSREIKTHHVRHAYMQNSQVKLMTIKSNAATKTKAFWHLHYSRSTVNPSYLTLEQEINTTGPRTHKKRQTSIPFKKTSFVVPQETQQRNHLAPLSRDRILDLPHLQPT